MNEVIPELKPCPFCGSPARFDWVTDPEQAVDKIKIHCSECFCETPTISIHHYGDAHHIYTGMIETWNRRAPGNA